MWFSVSADVCYCKKYRATDGRYLVALNNWLTIRQAAALCGVSARTFYDWKKRKYGPPSFRIGGQTRYKSDDVNTWIEGQRE